MPIEIIHNGVWYIERKFDTTIPNPPNLDIKRKPIEEQLTHILDKILKLVPENDDLLILTLNVLWHIHSW